MSTYTPIASQTLGSATATVTFTNIPQNFTDLILVTGDILNASNLADMYLQFNSDTSSNYSRTFMESSSSSASTNRSSNQTTLALGRSYGGDRTQNIFQINNYSNSSTNKTVLCRYGSGDASSSSGAAVGLWRSTSAITSITLGIDGGYNFSSGSTFNLYGIQLSNALATKATGGNIITTDGTYWYHTFTSSGYFTPTQSLTADYLVVAGGGGGGSVYGGGGGGGGLRCTVGATGGGGSLESALSLTAQTYTVIIGAGGVGGQGNAGSQTYGGSQGSNSTFSTITSIGGGGGATDQWIGTTGGSGGGGAFTVYNAGYAGTANQGFAGGAGTSSNPYIQGAGGGAGEAGNTDGQGEGGDGVATSISGTSTYYGGGGGAGGNSITPSGGLGGGAAGNGGSAPLGINGTANTGGGGSGTGYAGPPQNNGGSGGSGIVIVRYLV
jgi:hypothetical protein